VKALDADLRAVEPADGRGLVVVVADDAPRPLRPELQIGREP
jgi:hypothetical protein